MIINKKITELFVWWNKTQDEGINVRTKEINLVNQYLNKKITKQELTNGSLQHDLMFKKLRIKEIEIITEIWNSYLNQKQKAVIEIKHNYVNKTRLFTLRKNLIKIREELALMNVKKEKPIEVKGGDKIGKITEQIGITEQFKLEEFKKRVIELQEMNFIKYNELMKMGGRIKKDDSDVGENFQQQKNKYLIALKILNAISDREFEIYQENKFPFPIFNINKVKFNEIIYCKNNQILKGAEFD